MKCAILPFLLVFAGMAQLAAQEEASELQTKARKVAASVDYERFITGDAKTGDAPAAGEFTDWLLAEANNPSLLRDQIADDLESIETNGRNSESVEYYFTTGREYLKRVVFRAKDVKVSCVGGDKGVFTYQASFHTWMGVHHGWIETGFIFTFLVKVESFVDTKSHLVKVISYPKFEKKNEKEMTIPRVKE